MSDGDVSLPGASLGTCTWCDKPAVEQLIVTPGRKNRKLAPVCREHMEKYERQGLETVGTETERKAQAALKRAAWRRNQNWR